MLCNIGKIGVWCATLVCGDFNIHVDDVANSNTALLNDLVTSYNLSQHVRSPTHEAGHTLDLILTRSSDNSITISNILHSDHALVECKLNISKPPPNKIVIKTRKFREIDIDAFRCDITKSALFLAPSPDLVTLVEQYENILSDLLNRHAPEITQTITARPHAPWYCDSLREAKRDLRRWERLRDSTNLEVYKQVFRAQRARYKALLNKTRCENTTGTHLRIVILGSCFRSLINFCRHRLRRFFHPRILPVMYM